MNRNREAGLALAPRAWFGGVLHVGNIPKTFGGPQARASSRHAALAKGDSEGE
jgi:hypothetical protein